MKTSLIIVIIVVLGVVAGAFWYFYRPNVNEGQIWATAETQETLPGWEGYAHPSLPFAFAHSKELVSNTFQDGESEIVLLQGPDPNQEIQIVARAFDEPGPLTVERIQRDVPEMVIDEPQNVLIGSAQIPALLFWSTDNSAGRTREVWFVQGGYLYQVTTKAENDELLAGIMETWTFE